MVESGMILFFSLSVGPATIEPALDPMYGIPSSTRRLMGSNTPASYKTFKSRNVFSTTDEESFRFTDDLLRVRDFVD
jgi:hypothetical protein